MINNYNFIAPYYGILSRLVYGHLLINAQKHLVDQLPLDGDLLFIGGGNGDLLPYLYGKRPKLNIEYLEASKQMIFLARSKKHELQKIIFTMSSEFETQRPFDYVLAPFVFDMFYESETKEIIRKLEAKNKVIPEWYVCDFDSSADISFLDKVRLQLSILFFRLVSAHKLTFLPIIMPVFTDLGYRTRSSLGYRGGFVCAKVFEKRQ